jgi:hypothetical protein
MTMSRLELEVRAIQDVLAKLRNFTAYCKTLEIEATTEVRHLVRVAPRLHPQLWALVIDIQQYRPVWVERAPTKQLPELGMVDSVGDWALVQDDDVDPDTPTRLALATPARQPSKARFHPGPAAHIFFDGGSQGGVGTAGFVILGSDNVEVERVGIRMQSGMTNNEAESAALCAAVQRYSELLLGRHPTIIPTVRIFGDS